MLGKCLLQTVEGVCLSISAQRRGTAQRGGRFAAGKQLRLVMQLQHLYGELVVSPFVFCCCHSCHCLFNHDLFAILDIDTLLGGFASESGAVE